MPPLSRQIWRKVLDLNKPCSDAKYLINRNPRNLERLTIGYKPNGYHLEKPGRCFWHKLELDSSGRYITAKIIHHEMGPVIQASTSEWAMKKQLYKPNDKSAYINLARVLADRCHQFGVTQMSCTIESVPDSKVDQFIKTFVANGMTLTEPERFLYPRPWDATRQPKTWSTIEKKSDIFSGLFIKS